MRSRGCTPRWRRFKRRRGTRGGAEAKKRAYEEQVSSAFRGQSSSDTHRERKSKSGIAKLRKGVGRERGCREAGYAVTSTASARGPRLKPHFVTLGSHIDPHPGIDTIIPRRNQLSEAGALRRGSWGGASMRPDWGW